MNWLYYLAEANLYLCVFYLAYCVFLVKETHYQLNRAYLLLSCILAFALPVLQVGVLKPAVVDSTPVASYVVTQPAQYMAPSNIISAPVVAATPAFSIDDYLWLAYAAGAVVVLILLTLKLYSVFKLTRNNKARLGSYKMVYLKDTDVAFSFFNYLFIGTKAAGANTIITHELVHIRQKHSADIMFLELLKVICWFNPCIYLLQNSLKTVHEYIADEQTAATEADALTYSSFLVNNAYGAGGSSITHSFFNYNLLKKRIIMLNQQRSGKIARLKYLVAVPIGAALLCASTLGFSKTYGWIDLAPVHIAQQPKRIAPPPPMPPKRKAGGNYYGLAYFIEPYKYSIDDLKKTSLSLQESGYKMKYRKIGSNQLYISIETLPHLGQHRSANATFNMDELKKLNHVVAIGGGSYSGKEKVFVRSGTEADMKKLSLSLPPEPPKPKVDQVKFPPVVKPKKTDVVKFPPPAVKWQKSKLSPPPPEPPKPKVDQVRFPTLVKGELKTTSNGYKYEETGYLIDGKETNFRVIIHENDEEKAFFRNSATKAQIKLLKDKYGYSFPTMEIHGRMPPPPPMAPVEQPAKPTSSLLNKRNGNGGNVTRAGLNNVTIEAPNQKRKFLPLIIVNNQRYTLSKELKDRYANGEHLVFSASDSTASYVRNTPYAISKWGSDAAEGVVTLFGKTSITSVK